MDKKRAIITAIFIVFIIGIVVGVHHSTKKTPSQTFYLQTEICNIYLPKHYRCDTANPVNVYHEDKNAAHIRFGTLKSFTVMESLLIKNTNENIVLLEQSTKDNLSYFYYTTTNNGIVEYAYIIYIQDSNTALLMSSLEQDEIERIFKGMSLDVEQYTEEEKHRTLVGN